MRGEEVQLLGATAAGMIDPDALVCHPGTHNKWCVVRHGRIQSFRTIMTGELFNLLKEHSILADLLGGKVEANEAFKAGARQGQADDALPADLFSVRARVLLGKAKREGNVLSETMRQAWDGSRLSTSTACEVTSSAVCDRDSCLPSPPSWLSTGRNWAGGTFRLMLACDACLRSGSVEVSSA